MKENECMQITTNYVFYRLRNPGHEAKGIHIYNHGKSEFLRTFPKLSDVK